MAAGVGIAPTLSGLQPVAHLSKPSGGMVLPRGDAPRSAGYQPAALLLSYRRMNEIGGAPGNRTLDADEQRSGFRDRVLVYAGRAPLTEKMAPTPGFEPGTSTVRSGACRLSVTPCGLFEMIRKLAPWRGLPSAMLYGFA